MKMLNLAATSGSLVLLAASVAYAASLTNADKQFLITAARDDMTQAHEGQMAESQAARADVKSFAKTLVDDHTADYTQVSQLAAKVGVTVPTGINTSRNATIEQLGRLKGDRFDHQFTNDEIASHRQLLAAYQHEAKDGHDADVKAYAQKAIPVLEKHLQLAQQCAKPMGHS